MTDCKHNWHFIEGTDRLRCERCKVETAHTIDWSRAAVPTEQLPGYKLHDFRPTNSILFFGKVNDQQTEVLRISKDGIWANPDIPTDEAAKKVLEAIGNYVTTMVSKVRQEELNACCELLEGMHAATTGDHNYYLWAANELRRLRANK